MTKVNGYFHRVLAQTSTQFHINTAIQADLEYFLEQGAVCNTSNPTHIPRAIKADRELWQPVIDKILKENPEATDDEVADLLLQRITSRSLKMFWPLYKQSEGKYGYVAIQGNPFTNEDLPEVLEKAQTYSKLGKNVAVKIQSTKAGAKAIEELTALGVNTICTKGFSVSQGIEMAEAYERGLERTVLKPKCFVVNIAGILDEYLAEVAEAQKIDIAPESISHAGVTMTRVLYRIFKERDYKAYIQGGGSREPYHFTELVGGDLAITISPSQARPLIELNPPVVSRIDAEIPEDMLKKLEELPDFSRAINVEGLTPEEFYAFGPCMKFQKSCEEGYKETLREIKARHVALM